MTNYQPKGSMCATCKNRDRDCSWLPFDKMPVLQRRENGVIVVKCLDFTHRRTNP